MVFMSELKRKARSTEADGRMAPPGDHKPAVSFRDIHLTVFGTLDAVEQDWRAFEKFADCTVFQTFDWIAAWVREVGHASATQPAIILGRHQSDGKLLFILPWAVHTSYAGRSLTFLGDSLCDYNAPMISPDFNAWVPASTVANLFATCVAMLQSDARYRHDFVVLRKMPELIGSQPNPFAELSNMLHPSGAHSTRLGDDWMKFYAAKRSSAARRGDRSRERKLAELGASTFVTMRGRPQIQAALRALFEMKTHTFARMGVANLFAFKNHERFFLAASESEYAHISALKLNDDLIAVNLGLMFRGVYHYVLTTYAEELSRCSPGNLHLRELLQHAIANKCHMFDFTIGDEAYKLDWSDTNLILYDYVGTDSLAGLTPAVILRVASEAKRFIKHTPHLWRVTTKLRSIFGRRQVSARPSYQID
jgi:CelD/BcsL family acetyltransferase involved in cellulose biosynthesis